MATQLSTHPGVRGRCAAGSIVGLGPRQDLPPVAFGVPLVENSWVPPKPRPAGFEANDQRDNPDGPQGKRKRSSGGDVMDNVKTRSNVGDLRYTGNLTYSSSFSGPAAGELTSLPSVCILREISREQREKLRWRTFKSSLLEVVTVG